MVQFDITEIAFSLLHSNFTWEVGDLTLVDRAATAKVISFHCPTHVKIPSRLEPALFNSLHPHIPLAPSP